MYSALKHLLAEPMAPHNIDAVSGEPAGTGNDEVDELPAVVLYILCETGIWVAFSQY